MKLVPQQIKWQVESVSGDPLEVWLESDGDVCFEHEIYVKATDLIALAEAVKNELNNNTQEGE